MVRVARSLGAGALVALAALTACGGASSPGATASSSLSSPSAARSSGPSAAGSAASPRATGSSAGPSATGGSSSRSPAAGASNPSAASYCAVYKSAGNALQGSASTASEFGAVQKYVARLQKAAPTRKLTQAWGTVGHTFTKLHRELAKIGVSLDDLGKLQHAGSASDLPKGVSKKDVQRVTTILGQLARNNKLLTARKTIATYTKSHCTAATSH